MHDYARRLALATSPGAAGAGGPMGVAAVTSVDAMFKRKRGRPPKNRIIEVGRGRSRAPRRSSGALEALGGAGKEVEAEAKASLLCPQKKLKEINKVYLKQIRLLFIFAL